MRLAPALMRPVTVFAAVAVVGAFFLPWMGGAQELRFHSFSGFDFARLVRNFEITAGSQSETGQIRATALLIYLMPALAANAAVLALLESPACVSGRLASGAAALAGAYGMVVLGALLLLSIVEVNDFADVVGGPEFGFAISTVGSGMLLGAGVSGLRR